MIYFCLNLKENHAKEEEFYSYDDSKTDGDENQSRSKKSDNESEETEDAKKQVEAKEDDKRYNKRSTSHSPPPSAQNQN